MYWGMEGGLGSTGTKYKVIHYDYYDAEFTEIRHQIHISPITIGWKYAFTDKISVDVHTGLFASVDYAGKQTGEDEDEEYDVKMGDWEDGYKRFDIGMRIGTGIWYDRYNLDLTWQRGFISRWETPEYDKCVTSNIMLRLGISF